MRNRHLLVCLVLSGFTGLAYELLWVRILALGFGSTTLSFAMVLAVFFGGLALGAWAAGRHAERFTRPVAAYAAIEVGTGLMALVIHPALTHVGSIFALVDPGPGIVGGLVRVALSAPLLLGPTILMGATLPIVTRAVVVEDAQVGSGSALVYGTNTLGAFLGTYLVTYWLLPELGVWASTLVTAGTNIAVGGLALVFEQKPTEAREEPTPRSAGEPDLEAKVRLVASALALLSGFSAICLQVVWVRLVSIFLDGTIYGVGSVLIAVLLGIGLGSLLVAPALRTSRTTALWLSGLQIAILLAVTLLTASLPWIAYTLRSIPETAPGVTGLHMQLLVVLSVLFVPSLASGASFPLLMAIAERRASRASRSLGVLYAANTVGSIAGSLSTGFVLVPAAGTVATLLVGLVGVGLVGALAPALLDAGPRPARLGLALASLGLVAAWPGFDVQLVSLIGTGSAAGRSYADFRRALEKRKADVVYFSEGRAATVVVSGDDRRRGLMLSGLGQGSYSSLPPRWIYESSMVALVPMAHVERAERALVVGLGVGATVEALLELGAARVDVAELEEAVAEAQRSIYPPGEGPLDDPRVTLRMGDARQLLLQDRARGGGGYDVIASMPAHPWVSSSIFTREFFALARDNLTEAGVFSTWFGLRGMNAEAVDSLTRAFAQVFESYVVYHAPEAGALYLVGSKRALRIDVDRFGRLRRTPALDDVAITSDLHLATQVLASALPGDPGPTPGVVNSDDSAFVEVQAPRTSTVTGDGPPHASFPFPFAKPDMLAPAERRASTAVEIVEELLGTPGGRPSPIRRPVPTARVERALEGFRPILAGPTVAYLEGRLALARGEAGRARARLAAAATGTEAPRAARFLPYTLPEGSPERLASLRSLPPSGDVWIARLEAGDQDLGLPAQPPRSEDDPWGWLVWHAHTDSSTVGADGRAILARLGRELQRATSLPALEAAVRLAERMGWRTEASSLHAARVRVRSQAARQLLRRANREGQRGRFAEAAVLLERVLALDGTLEPAYERLLSALVELGRWDEVRTLRVRMEFAGFIGPRIDELVERAKAGRLKAEALEKSGSHEPATDDPAPATPVPFGEDDPRRSE